MKPKNPSFPGDKNRLAEFSTGMAALAVCVVGATAHASTDYPPATFYGTGSCSKWNTSGHGKKFYVHHDMEGYYLTGISYLQQCSVSVSIHYLVNGKKDTTSDAAAGAVGQMVRDAYYAWHARCWNGYSMGTEHEGFRNNPAWYTEQMYSASSLITRAKCEKYGFAKDRNHCVGHDEGSRSSAWRTYASANFGIDPTCNTHDDPGPYWNWNHFMDLVKGVVSVPAAPSSLTATTASTSQINLAWADNSSNESGFKVERSTSSGSGFAEIGTVGANVKTYSSTGLASGTTYYYRVRAYNASGNSGYSNTANATTKDTIPAAPTGLTATTISDVQINLAWTDGIPNEDGFRIYRSTDGTTYTLVTSTAINATSYSDTGLTGNRTYWYKIAAFNTAGNSTDSNVASTMTGPAAPSALAVNSVSGSANWNKLALTWTDNAGGEVGFKIERGTAAAGPFTQIGTNNVGVTSYTDSGLAALTTYYYRVRSYNANGNSSYTAVVNKATPNAPPILNTIADQTVSSGMTLSFTAVSSDPNAPAPVTTTIGTWEGSPHGDREVVFRDPLNSSTTASFIDTAQTNYSMVVTNAPAGVGGTHALKAQWTFKTGTTDYWVRLNTFNAPVVPNPTVALDQIVKFRIYSTKALKVGVGFRETGTTAAYGANGGTTGTLDWAGVTNVVSGNPIPNHAVPANTWTTVSYNIPFEPQASFTGNGQVDQSGAKGVLEHLIVRGEGGPGSYTIYIDDLAVVVQNDLVYSLDAGAPAGATIERRTGKFSWTPAAGTSGDYPITVRVTDGLGGTDFQTFNVSVTGTGNAAPVLAAIGNKSVNEASTLSFNATATDPNGGQTLTYSLDAGAPAGASITSGGAFSWTPTESQGPGTFPITVRVTDNGSPVSNDFETITVTVNEVNTTPVIAAISNQSVNEGSTLNLTASATDADVPANTIAYSISGPPGMTIDSTSGAISYTPGETDGGQVYQVTVTATDNGTPVLKGTKTFNVTVNEVNTAPTLTVGAINALHPFAQFDELDDEGVGGHNNEALFRVPYFSGTTTQFLDSTSFAYITNSFPRDSVNSSYQALYVNWQFKTGTTNPWCRLATFTSSSWTNGFAYPNPTIDLGQHVRFKVWSSKSVKIALGVRETGTQNPIGLDGGTSGALEWVGATASAGVPAPTRTITASNWVQLDFNLPAETIASFTGNGALAAGKGVLEHLVIVPNGGTGFYTMYLDDFETLSVKTNTTFSVDTGDTLTVNTSASDTDSPSQNLTFSLGAGAPTNAAIHANTGVFTWKPMPDQSPSTNAISLVVTDNGSPNLSGSQTITVTVNKVNTPPRLNKIPDLTVENNSGAAVSFNADAQDDDVPAQSLTYSLTSGPSGSSITSGGAFSWTPPSGVSTTTVLIRVTDNGTPPLWDEQSVVIKVVPTNAAPVLGLGIARATETVFTFETFTNNTPNEAVMFKKPANSSTTVAFVDTAVNNYTTVTTSFPAGNANAGSKVLKTAWSFKAGVSNYWVRLNTLNTTFLPNPAINASARLRFDIHTDKALKVCLGIRETGTTAENGANGGTTGNIEFVGATSVVSSCPQATRTVSANTWTTLEFDLPNEPTVSFTGNGVLSPGQQALEHIALIGAGGTGAYTVHMDNFKVVTTTTLPGTVTIKANSSLTFTASATDPDPGAGLSYGLDADFVETHPTAALDQTAGVFTWTPGASDIGTTNSITVTGQDSPTNGGLVKSDSKTLTVVVTSDTLGTQGAEGFVAGGDTSTLVWDSKPGTTYAIQTRSSASGEWKTVQTETATDTSTTVEVVNDGTDTYFRIIEVTAASNE